MRQAIILMIKTPCAIVSHQYFGIRVLFTGAPLVSPGRNGCSLLGAIHCPWFCCAMLADSAGVHLGLAARGAASGRHLVVPVDVQGFQMPCQACSAFLGCFRGLTMLAGFGLGCWCMTAAGGHARDGIAVLSLLTFKKNFSGIFT